MATDMTNKQIRLRDGRSLGYAEYRSPQGKPAFCFHGFPGSRLDWTYFDDANYTAELNVQAWVSPISSVVESSWTGLAMWLNWQTFYDWSVSL